jgi:hypothetical protein
MMPINHCQYCFAPVHLYASMCPRAVNLAVAGNISGAIFSTASEEAGRVATALTANATILKGMKPQQSHLRLGEQSTRVV